MKSGRPCACYIKLYSPNNIQKTETALGVSLCLQSKFPSWINKLQQNTSQLHTFPHSPKLEITQDVILVLQIPSKGTPKNNLDNLLGYSKATGLHKECTNTKKVGRQFSHAHFATSEKSLIQWERRPWFSGGSPTGGEVSLYIYFFLNS